MGVLVGCLLGGCAARDRSIVGDTAYARSFEAAKVVLREASFDLERVDARAGIITTRPRASSGLATPWIDHTETLGDATRDLFNADQRIVVVRFRADGAPDGPKEGDLRRYEGPLVGEITVERERLYRPNRRTDPTSIRFRSTTIDPDHLDRGMLPVFAADLAPDQRLAQRLADRLETMTPEGVAFRPSATR